MDKERRHVQMLSIDFGGSSIFPFRSAPRLG